MQKQLYKYETGDIIFIIEKKEMLKCLKKSQLFCFARR